MVVVGAVFSLGLSFQGHLVASCGLHVGDRLGMTTVVKAQGCPVLVGPSSKWRGVPCVALQGQVLLLVRWVCQLALHPAPLSLLWCSTPPSLGGHTPQSGYSVHPGSVA